MLKLLVCDTFPRKGGLKFINFVKVKLHSATVASYFERNMLMVLIIFVTFTRGLVHFVNVHVHLYTAPQFSPYPEHMLMALNLSLVRYFVQLELMYTKCSFSFDT